MDLGTGRSRLRMLFLVVLNEGLDWKLASLLIHDLAELGKKLFMHFSVLHDIS